LWCDICVHGCLVYPKSSANFSCTTYNHHLLQMAIDFFQGYEVNGKQLKVEPIRDHEKYGRIRVPGKIIEYAVGPIKMQRNGLNTMRRATSSSSRLDSNACEDGTYEHEREQRQARMQKRKNRGRYKNQQRKNSRATKGWL
jgi:hypothetical protein